MASGRRVLAAVAGWLAGPRMGALAEAVDANTVTVERLTAAMASLSKSVSMAADPGRR